MARIKIITENGENIFPITHDSAVLDSNGKSVRENIDDINRNFVKAENTTSEIENNENDLLQRISMLESELESLKNKAISSDDVKLETGAVGVPAVSISDRLNQVVLKQDMQDYNLETGEKSIVGAINEVYNKAKIFKPNSVSLGNYSIEYNYNTDTLDFVYTGGDVAPLYEYINQNLSLYIDANNLGTTAGKVNDISGNGVDITLEGNLTKILDENGYMTFYSDGLDYLDTNFVPPVDNWTFEFYGYYRGTSEVAQIAGWGTESANRISIGNWADGYFMIVVDGDDPHNIVSIDRTILPFHACIVCNNGILSTYYNGIKQTEKASAILTTHTATLKIGTKYSANGEFADMNMKQLRFYSKALNDAEIMNNYNFCIQ